MLRGRSLLDACSDVQTGHTVVSGNKIWLCTPALALSCEELTLIRGEVRGKYLRLRSGGARVSDQIKRLQLCRTTCLERSDIYHTIALS